MNPITDELIALAKNGQLLSRGYVRKKINAVKKRKQGAPWHLERVRECLKRVVDYAAAKNVRLGIEGRRGYEEMPNERELSALLEELNSPFAGYWHDFGHIQIKENLGFLESRRMVAPDGAARLWLSCAGCDLAGPGSSAAVCRSRRSG